MFFSLLYGGHAGILCRGLIGTSKFCLKVASNCGAQSHTKKFDVEPSTFYLKEIENRAFINPSFKVENLDDSSLASFLSGRFTLKEVEVLIGRLNTPTIH